MAENLKIMLAERGLKLTQQRGAVLEALQKSAGSHISCEELAQAVKAVYPETGIATVYRTLTLFEQMGIVSKQDFGDGCWRYELKEQGNGHGHHHLICLGCGKISEADEDLLDDLERQIKNKKGFVTVNHQLVMYGYCKDCSGKESKS